MECFIYSDGGKIEKEGRNKELKKKNGGKEEK